MSRALLRSVLELRAPSLRTLLTPLTTAPTTTQARFFNQTTQIIEPVDPSSLPPQQAQQQTPSQLLHSQSAQQPPKQPNPPTRRTLPTTPSPLPTGPISESVRTLLPLLAAQPSHYITIHIHGRPYLVTEGDSVRLPFKMPGAEPGDVLRLNRASVLGSRDFTLKGEPWVDERLFECRAIVTGTEQEPVRVMIKKKRRCRRKKHVYSQHRYTMLTISELKVVTDAV